MGEVDVGAVCRILISGIRRARSFLLSMSIRALPGFYPPGTTGRCLSGWVSGLRVTIFRGQATITIDFFFPSVKSGKYPPSTALLSIAVPLSITCRIYTFAT